jgi:sirohydrochlorin ferrochelatase
VAVAQQQVVRRRKRVEEQRLPRRVDAEGVTVESHGGGLVQGDPAVDPVAEALAELKGEVAETSRRVAIQPPAPEFDRGVPVE